MKKTLRKFTRLFGEYGNALFYWSCQLSLRGFTRKLRGKLVELVELKGNMEISGYLNAEGHLYKVAVFPEKEEDVASFKRYYKELILDLCPSVKHLFKRYQRHYLAP